jgi:hypothetical protein
MVSKRWSVLTQTTLYGVILVLTLGSLAIYGDVVDVKPPGSANAFLWVAVPPASWLFMTIVVPTAAFISARLPRRALVPDPPFAPRHNFFSPRGPRAGRE